MSGDVFDLLGKLWAMLFATEHESAAAREALKRHLLKHNLHPSDIALVPARSHQLALRLTKTLEMYEAELERRRRAEEQVENLRAEMGELRKNKRSRLLASTSRRPGRQTTPAARSSTYRWTPESYQLALRLLIEEGRPGQEVAAHFGLTEGQIWGKFKNRALDEELLPQPVEVKTEGPMSTLELWKIGHDLYGEGWRAKIEDRFQKSGRVILFRPPAEVLTPEEIQILRRDWHSKGEDAYKVFERLCLRAHKESKNKDVKIAWIRIFDEMRQEGAGVTNTFGPEFAARFNSEHFELLRIREKAAREWKKKKAKAK